jgi:hypothetical protein
MTISNFSSRVLLATQPMVAKLKLGNGIDVALGSLQATSGRATFGLESSWIQAALE